MRLVVADASSLILLARCGQLRTYGGRVALDERARSPRKDRASFVRELLAEGLARDREEEVFRAYRDGRLSLSDGASRLGVALWAWFDLLRRRNETLNVELEDRIDSRAAL